MAYQESVAFSDLCDELQNSGSERALEEAMSRFVRRNGYAWFAYIHKSAEEARGASTYPDDWKAVYLDRNYVQIDPVLKAAQREPLPFTWDAERFDESRSSRSFFSLAADFNVRRGVTVPIAGTYASFAALTLAASNNDNSGPASAENHSILTLAALHYHMHTNRVRERMLKESPDRGGLLTTRARLCLLWVARGKTIEEASKILNIHEATVRYHLNEARKRLDAVSLPHLVAEAIKRGEISY